MGRRSRGDSVLTAFPEAEVMPSGAPRLAGPPPPFHGVGWKNGARTGPGVGPTETAVKTPKRTMCRGGPEPPTETRTRRPRGPRGASGSRPQPRPRKQRSNYGVAVLSEQGAPGRCSAATGGRWARAGLALPCPWPRWAGCREGSRRRPDRTGSCQPGGSGSWPRAASVVPLHPPPSP